MKFASIALFASVVAASKDDLSARKQLFLSQLEEIDNQINLEDAAGTDAGTGTSTDASTPKEEESFPWW